MAEAYLLFSDFEGFPSFRRVSSAERLATDRLRRHSTIGGRDEWVLCDELAPVPSPGP